jgi:hypothetical protein
MLLNCHLSIPGQRFRPRAPRHRFIPTGKKLRVDSADDGCSMVYHIDGLGALYHWLNHGEFV